MGKFEQSLNPLDLNINQALKDLRDEKAAIDETITALERLLTRQQQSSRKTPTASLAPVRSVRRGGTSETKK
jgi:hypothetical protein